MNNKIDGVFEYKSYRYIPYNLRNEWKTMYNLISKKFYKEMNEKYKLFPYKQIDFYNEELRRYNEIQKLSKDFAEKVKDLKPMYNSDIEYSEDIKNSLLVSLSEIDKFININKSILLKKVIDREVPIKNDHSIEHFEQQCNNDLDTISNRKPIIFLSILFIIIFYIFI